MTYSQDRRPQKPNHCHYCGRRLFINNEAWLKWRWTSGDAFGIPQMIQVHHECLALMFDAVRGKRGVS